MESKLPFKHTDPIAVVKCVGVRLLPFFKTVAIFFVIFPERAQTFSFGLLKCAPILSLMTFVHVFGTAAQASKTSYYASLILYGLGASMLGDLCLVFDDYLIMGIVMFGFAHCFYIYAFGENLKIVLSTQLLLMVMAACRAKQVTGLIYVCMVARVVWRASLRAYLQGAGCPWTEMAACLGAVLFALSDSLLILEHLVPVTALALLPGSTLYVPIMVTYYAAQMCYAASIVDTRNDIWKVLRNDL